MIRYKKHRRLQQGGVSPAAGVQAGAAATAAVGSATPYKIASPQTLEMPGDKAGGGGAGRRRTGGTKPGNAFTGKYLTAVNVPNMVIHYNDKLDKLQADYNKRVASDPDYATSSRGTAQLSEYKKKYAAYSSTLKNLDKIYAKAKSASEKTRNQPAILADGTTFVFDSDEKKIKGISYDEFLLDKQKGPDSKYPLGAVSLDGLVELLDAPEMYDDETGVNKYAKIIPSIIADSPDIVTVNQTLKTLAQVNPVDITKDNWTFPDKMVLTTEGINKYDGTDTEGENSYITDIVKTNFTQSPAFKTLILQEVAADDVIITELDLKPEVRAAMIEQSINKKAWEMIQPYYKNKDLKPEEVAADNKANSDLLSALAKDQYYAATTNFDDSAREVGYDTFLVEYDNEGNKIKPPQTEGNLKTVAVSVAVSVKDIREEIDAVAGIVKDTIIKDETTEGITLADITTISMRGSIERMQFADGSNAHGIKHSDNYARDYIPVIGKPMVFTQLPTVNGKIALWLIDILADVGDAQSAIIDKVTKEFDSKSSMFAGEEEDKKTEAIAAEVNKRMAEKYPEIVGKYRGTDNRYEDIPNSYEEFKATEAFLGNFWVVDVISEIDDDVLEGSTFVNFTVEGDGMSGSAKSTIEKYQIEDSGGTLVETKVFLPVAMNTGVDFKQGTGIMAQLTQEANNIKLNLGELAPGNRALFQLIKVR